GVEKNYAAVRAERADKPRGAEPAGHAIEHDRGAAGLVEAHALSRADIERIPVDDRAVARLIDVDRGAALALNGRHAADHRGAFRAGRSRHRGERHERRGQEHEIAGAWMHRSPLAEPT